MKNVNFQPFFVIKMTERWKNKSEERTYIKSILHIGYQEHKYANYRLFINKKKYRSITSAQFKI